MSNITLDSKGSFKRTFSFLRKIRDVIATSRLEYYGRLGVEALREATPKDTGLTSESWKYEIEKTESSVSIYWSNTNNNHGVYIAVLLQNGHATGTGGYVQGIDYINPAMKPIFKKMADDLWLEVKSS